MTSISHANPNFGRGIVSLRPEEVEVLDMAEVVWRLHALFKSPTYKPPRLPEVALKLLAMMRSSDVQLRRITAVLEEDQLLAAEILRLAQSAAYASATGAAVRSLEEALVRLGQQRTADILLEASLNQRVFRVKAYQRQMDELRRHSTAVAHLARLVSRQTSLYDEHVFMCGLLHDVGVAGALIAFAEAVPRQDHGDAREMADVRHVCVRIFAPLIAMPARRPVERRFDQQAHAPSVARDLSGGLAVWRAVFASRSAARQTSAMIECCGFTPRFVGNTLASIT